MKPSIKTVLGVGSASLMIFLMLGSFYNYTKASEVSGTIKTSLGNYSDLAKSYIPDAHLLAIGEFYIWVGTSTFTKMGTNINQMVTQLNTMAGQISAAAQKYGVNINISSIANALLPSTIFYYIFGIIAGFAGGILQLKKESKFVDAAFAPILPALIITIVFIAGSVLIETLLKSQTASAAALIPPFAFGIMDYLMVFIITYVFVMIGTLSAALVRHFIWKAKPAEAAAQPTPKAPTAKPKKKK